MDRIRLTMLLGVFVLLSVYQKPSFAQGFGIDASSPKTKLDVNGDFALRISSFAASSGSNNNINIGNYSFIRMTASNNFNINGIAGGVDGKMIIIYNSSAYDMSISHQNTSSTNINRIICSDNTSATIRQKGCAHLIYSETDSRWILISRYN